jgi:hypothetical protein
VDIRFQGLRLVRGVGAPVNIASLCRVLYEPNMFAYPFLIAKVGIPSSDFGDTLMSWPVH